MAFGGARRDDVVLRQRLQTAKLAVVLEGRDRVIIVEASDDAVEDGERPRADGLFDPPQGESVSMSRPERDSTTGCNGGSIVLMHLRP